jgi:hypothetical protein
VSTSLFSSPSKQANAAANAQQGLTDHTIQQLEDYVGTQQGQERSAIAGLGTNPYLGAAAQMNPSAYRVDPSNTQTFGQGAHAGLSQGASTSQTAGIPPSSSNPFMPSRKSIAFPTGPSSASNPVPSPATRQAPSTPAAPVVQSPTPYVPPAQDTSRQDR